jgi:hypothetical protein
VCRLVFPEDKIHFRSRKLTASLIKPPARRDMLLIEDRVRSLGGKYPDLVTTTTVPVFLHLFV